jgi:hypothetical protein
MKESQHLRKAYMLSNIQVQLLPMIDQGKAGSTFCAQAPVMAIFL